MVVRPGMSRPSMSRAWPLLAPPQVFPRWSVLGTAPRLAGDHRPVEVEVEHSPRARSCHEMSSVLTRPVHVQEARAVRVG
jgi:hypothetical protein